MIYHPKPQLVYWDCLNVRISGGNGIKLSETDHPKSRAEKAGREGVKERHVMVAILSLQVGGRQAGRG